MSSMWGENFRISLFGESHGVAIGVTIDGVEPGLVLDMDFIKGEMRRRRPGLDLLSTTRGEDDEFEILSGAVEHREDGEAQNEGKTVWVATGTPLCAMIRNKDKRSQDYANIDLAPRPGHADYTGWVKYKGKNDPRGGGHFSGRITAGLVFAGAVAKLMLAGKGIFVGAHIKSVYDVEDRVFEAADMDKGVFDELAEMRIPVLNGDVQEPIRERIMQARSELDSVGGVIEVAVIGVPAGFGSPFFDSVESKLSQVMFGVPAVKGIGFGKGFDFAKMKGSEANDPFEMQDGKVVTTTNNNGGINGGITNGMPIVFSTVVKATSSISKKQNTVDLKTMNNTEIQVKGRHDPCIVIRAVPVVESATAIAMADLIF